MSYMKKLTPEEYSDARKEAMLEVQQREEEQKDWNEKHQKEVGKMSDEEKPKKVKSERVELSCATCGKKRSASVDWVAKQEEKKPNFKSEWVCKDCAKKAKAPAQ